MGLTPFTTVEDMTGAREVRPLWGGIGWTGRTVLEGTEVGEVIPSPSRYLKARHRFIREEVGHFEH